MKKFILTVIFILLTGYAWAVPCVSGPNAQGIIWTTGKQYTVCWSGYPTNVSTVRIYLDQYVKDQYGYWNYYTSYPINPAAPNAPTGRYTWTVPLNQPEGQYKVTVYTPDRKIGDASNYLFMITNPRVVEPNNTFYNAPPGSSMMIRWVGYTDPYLKIRLYKGGILYKTITDYAKNYDNTEHYYSWIVPSVPSASDYQIVVYASRADVSDNCFTIANPAIIYPTKAGIVWIKGNTYNIKFIGFGLGETKTVVIALLTSGGDVYKTIDYKAPNNGFYAWTVPTTIPSGLYKIRIGSYTKSLNTFTIQ
jgi:hypothetical protein